ncbi:hypothetical protein B0H17DRAFT_1136204 [Mycena rosella]|uniref:Uncharacterized protein n=1 Tax=Mycena rosella TaxID=1033263 RepID=A0AAD7DBD1_MYCRO|nr:hypothetical protein B0H17DRAFT_1136204 [Mycena rosella]
MGLVALPRSRGVASLQGGTVLVIYSEIPVLPHIPAPAGTQGQCQSREQCDSGTVGIAGESWLKTNRNAGQEVQFSCFQVTLMGWGAYTANHFTAVNQRNRNQRKSTDLISGQLRFPCEFPLQNKAEEFHRTDQCHPVFMIPSTAAVRSGFVIFLRGAKDKPTIIVWVRTYRTSTTYTNHKTGIVKVLTDRQWLAQAMHAITDSSTLPIVKTGNAANAVVTAAGRANETIKRRRTIFAKLKSLSTVAKASVGSSLITMYSRNGGKAGTYENSYRRQFKNTRCADLSLGAIERFAHFPLNSFLAILPVEANEAESVKIYANHVEIGSRAYAMFESLMVEKELLCKAVATLNTVRCKGKADISLAELPEDDWDLLLYCHTCAFGLLDVSGWPLDQTKGKTQLEESRKNRKHTGPGRERRVWTRLGAPSIATRGASNAYRCSPSSNISTFPYATMWNRLIPDWGGLVDPIRAVQITVLAARISPASHITGDERLGPPARDCGRNSPYACRIYVVTRLSRPLEAATRSRAPAYVHELLVPLLVFQWGKRLLPGCHEQSNVIKSSTGYFSHVPFTFLQAVSSAEF